MGAVGTWTPKEGSSSSTSLITVLLGNREVVRKGRQRELASLSLILQEGSSFSHSAYCAQAGGTRGL